jgi:bacillithiol system protein YtxJ
MNTWNKLESEAELEKIIEKSTEKPQVIFKHSVTCGISAHAEDKLKNGSDLITAKADFNFLDLLSFRPISNLIAEKLGVRHQSPQIIVLKDKKVVYHNSHHAIDPIKIADIL